MRRLFDLSFLLSYRVVHDNGLAAAELTHPGNRSFNRPGSISIVSGKRPT